MRAWPWLPILLVLFVPACLTDFEPLVGDRTHNGGGSDSDSDSDSGGAYAVGAKVLGFEASIMGVGCLPDPYTVTQLVAYDNRAGDAPSVLHPLIIENAANNGYGAFSRDGLKNRDAHGTLGHNGLSSQGTLHVFERSVLAIDTAPGCQGFANVVRDNSGKVGAGIAICITGGPIELVDSHDLPLQDARGNQIRNLDDLMSLLIRSRLNAGDTRLDLRLHRMIFEDGELGFREPLEIQVGSAEFLNFRLDANENREAILQFIRYLKARETRSDEWFTGFTLDFSDFRVKVPENLSLAFNMERMLDVEEILSERSRTPDVGSRRR